MTQISPNALLDSLRWRYATKSFDPSRKLPQETLDALLASLVLSPSSFGLQPWKFLVVESPDLRSKLRAASWDQPQVTDASHLIVLTVRTTLTTQDIDESLARVTEVRGTPPESLKPLRDVMLGFAASKSDEEQFVWNSRQAYIALGQLMTCAAVLGVDACPLEGISPATYDEVLGLQSSGYRTVVACALGFRNPEDPYAAATKVRYAQQRVIETR